MLEARFALVAVLLGRETVGAGLALAAFFSSPSAFVGLRGEETALGVALFLVGPVEFADVEPALLGAAAVPLVLELGPGALAAPFGFVLALVDLNGGAFGDFAATVGAGAVVVPLVGAASALGT